MPDGTINQLPCPDAFGAILGTQMVCALLTILISFLPPQFIRKLFPKIVTGVVLLVISSSLLTSGTFLYKSKVKLPFLFYLDTHDYPKIPYVICRNEKLGRR